MDIEDHLEALGRLKNAIGGELKTPPRQTPTLVVDTRYGYCCIKWSEGRQAYLADLEDGGFKTFRTPEEAMRWFRDAQ